MYTAIIKHWLTGHGAEDQPENKARATGLMRSFLAEGGGVLPFSGTNTS